MNTIVPSDPRQLCACCGAPIASAAAHYDTDLCGVVHVACQMRLMLAEKQLRMAGLKYCVQVSGGKPLRGLG